MARIRLYKKHIDYLSTLPEHGMGYQIVDIKLKNGEELQNIVVLNSTYLNLNAEELISPKDIQSIVLHGEGHVSN